MRNADVVIVGGGPAGAAAAITAASKGLDCIVIDFEASNRELPGETLHPGADALFQRLGVSDAVHAASPIRPRGYWTNWVGRKQFTPFGSDANGDWLGYQVNRRTLRNILLDRARNAGADVRQHCRAINVLRDGDHVSGAETSEGNLSTRFVIDATGGSGWLSRKLNAKVMMLSPPLFAWYGWVQSQAFEQFREPHFLHDVDGWSWIAQVDRHKCAWVRLNLSGRRQFERLQRPKLLDKFEALDREHGVEVTWRAPSRVAGEGFFQVGDAAGLLDPGASDGVLRACLTGISAASHIANVLKHGHSASGQAHAFDRTCRQLILQKVSALRMYYGGMETLTRDRTRTDYLRYEPIY